MDTRRLGALTGLDVSVLGLGTVKFGRNRGVKYPQPFELPGDDQLREILRIARDGGINLLDTAPAYGVSEQRLGGLMCGPAAGDANPGVRYPSNGWGYGGREAWVVVTKVGETFDPDCDASAFDFRPEAVRPSVERSLARLRTDYLDVVLVHSDGHDLDIIDRWGTLDGLRDVQRAGLVRAIGISTKSVDGGLRAVEAGCDVVMVTWNPEHTSEGVVIDRARDHGVGVLVKKALLSGHVGRGQRASGGDPRHGCDGADTAGDASTDDHEVLGRSAGAVRAAPDSAACLRFTLGRPGVSSVVVGTITPEHLRANIAVAESWREGP